MSEEIWKSIPGFCKKYEASSAGNIRKKLLYENRLMKPLPNPEGRPEIRIYVGGKRKSHFVSRLVASTFLERPINKTQVHHINGNPSDNRVENLMWVTARENMMLKPYVKPELNPNRRIKKKMPAIKVVRYTDAEIWKTSQHFRNYEISNHGRARNISGRGNAVPIRKPSLLNGHHYALSVKNESGNWAKLIIHREVAFAFVANLNGGDFVNHIDGNKTNNHWSNLEWVSRQENERHASLTGLKCRGRDQWCAKLKQEDVLEIRRSNLSTQKLAKKFKVKRQTISGILSRKSWSWLKPE